MRRTGGLGGTDRFGCGAGLGLVAGRPRGRPLIIAALAAREGASFAMIAQPASAAARAISYFPLTAPMAKPGRIAMGAAAWWEPVAAAVLTLATTAALVQLAGRIYANSILHGGPRLSLKDAWRSTAAAGPSAAKAGPCAAHAWPRRIGLTRKRGQP